MSSGAAPPDWTRWLAQRQLPAWQCLALSVDVEPDTLGVDSFMVLHAADSELPMGGQGDPDWLASMAKRQSGLIAALADSKTGLAVRAVKQPHLDTPVKLAAFVAWARKHKWALPKALKDAFSEPVPKTKKSTRKPAKS